MELVLCLMKRDRERIRQVLQLENFVAGANTLRRDNGTTTGMAPFIHLAMYKVCDKNGCFESDIVVAIDDGVYVLSLLLGGGYIPFYNDDIAIGHFCYTKRLIMKLFNVNI